MPPGAPRTVSFSTEEMIKLGEEMLQWLKDNPETLHLSEWYTIHKGFTYNQWKSFIQIQDFLPYYEQAIKIVGIKYLNKDSKVRDGISQRWQRIYFKDLKEEEDETAKYHASLKDTEEECSKEYVDGLESILKLMKKRQNSARNMDKTNPNTDSKS
jgi:hypothetical protein